MDERIPVMALNAGMDEVRRAAFQKGLEENADILMELDFYICNNNFACKTKVEGFSLVDILVWQIDHFRLHLDRDTEKTKEDPESMVILACETMLNMRKDPEKYVKAMQSETGTDIIM